MKQLLLLVLSGCFFLCGCNSIASNLLANTYTHKFDKYQKKLKPDFQLPNESGEFLSLSDFKGKVIYMNLGGISCGACIAEIPYADSLKNRFKDLEDVVFLYITMSKNAEQWKQSIQERNIQGVHLIDSTGYVEEYFKTNVIPKYLLIGKQGQLLGFDIPRPSSKVLVDYSIFKALDGESAKTSLKKLLTHKISEPDRLWLENHMGTPISGFTQY